MFLWPGGSWCVLKSALPREALKATVALVLRDYFTQSSRPFEIGFVLVIHGTSQACSHLSFLVLSKYGMLRIL